jgi:hypothetical protein
MPTNVHACTWSDKNAFPYLGGLGLAKSFYLHCDDCLGVWWRETEKYESQRRRPRLAVVYRCPVLQKYRQLLVKLQAAKFFYR